MNITLLPLFLLLKLSSLIWYYPYNKMWRFVLLSWMGPQAVLLAVCRRDRWEMGNIGERITNSQSQPFNLYLKGVMCIQEHWQSEGNRGTSVHYHYLKDIEKLTPFPFTYNVHHSHSMPKQFLFVFYSWNISVHNWTSLKLMICEVRLYVFFAQPVIGNEKETDFGYIHAIKKW